MDTSELKILELESKNVPILSEKNSSIPSLSAAVKIAYNSKVGNYKMDKFYNI